MDDLDERLGSVLDSDVGARARVSGGDVADAFRVDLVDGRRVFAKTHADPPLHFFRTEATGLRWLREAVSADLAANDRADVRVPDVLAVTDDLLVLEWIDEGRASATSDAGFGAALAAIHRRSIDTFGRSDAMTTGSRALPNTPRASWPDFYASNRLLPLARLASDAGALADSTIDRLVVVADHLDALDASDENPALLHGDLWAGNRLIDERGGNWLVDPAAHGGHREFDLSMMLLFGGFGPDCFDAYHDAFPLAAGWRDRVPVHQLAPLVVHAIKFGGGYGAAVDRALDAADTL